MRFLVLFLLTIGLSVSRSSWAVEASLQNQDLREDSTAGSAPQKAVAPQEDADYFALADYSPLDLLIVNKIGFTVGIYSQGARTWELEYLRASVSVPMIVEDLGKMTDQRLSVIRRSHFGGGSFNLSYGLSYFDFSLHLGDRLLNGISGGAYPSVDVIQIQSLGFNLALGNRWKFGPNVLFGVDWLSWAQPVIETKRKSVFLDYATNQKDKDDVDQAMKIVSYFPRFAALKLQLGISF